MCKSPGSGGQFSGWSSQTYQDNQDKTKYCHAGTATWNGCRNDWAWPPSSTTNSCPKTCTCNGKDWKDSGGNGCFKSSCKCVEACQRSTFTANYPNRQDVTFYSALDLSPAKVKATVRCDAGYVWNDNKASGTTRTVTCSKGDKNCRVWTYNPFCINQWCKIPTPIGANVDATLFTYWEPHLDQPSCGLNPGGYTGAATRSAGISVMVGGLMNYHCAADHMFPDKDHTNTSDEQSIRKDVVCVAGAGDGDVIKGQGAEFGADSKGLTYDYNAPWDCEKTCEQLTEAAGQTISYVDSADVTLGSVLDGTRYKIATEAVLECQFPIYQIPPGGVSRIACLTTGQWNNTLTDCEMVCQKIPAFGNNVNTSTVNYTDVSDNAILVGGTVTVQCLNDYIWQADPKNEPIELTCDVNNVWSPITAAGMAATHCFTTCEYTNVTEWMVETNLTDYAESYESEGTNPHLFPLTSTAVIRCQINYVLSTNLNLNESTVTCKQQPADGDGSVDAASPGWWDDDTQKCVATCVPLVPEDTDTWYEYNDTTLANGNYLFGTTATKMCNNTAGCFLEYWHRFMTICLESGKWSVETANCVESCPALIANDTGDFINFDSITYGSKYNEDDGHLRHGGTVTMQCESGYEFSNDPDVTTLEVTCIHGVWSDPFYNCTLILDSPCDPDQTESERNQRIVSMLTSSLTTLTLIACCVLLLVVFVVICDFSLPRLYHMMEELTLLLTLFLIVPARSPTLFDSAAFCDPSNPDFVPPSLSADQCTIVSVILQYLFTVHFLSLLLEAIHNYTYFTHVFNEKACVRRGTFLVLAIITPLLAVVPSALFLWNTYTSKLTCWVNYAETISLIIVVPICFLAFTTIILSEATTMNRFPLHPACDEKWKTSAATNSKGCLVITTLSFAAYACSTFAVHTVDMSLYLVASILNVALALMLLMWHTVGSAKARQLMLKICPCCDKRGDEEKSGPPRPKVGPANDGNSDESDFGSIEDIFGMDADTYEEKNCNQEHDKAFQVGKTQKTGDLTDTVNSKELGDIDSNPELYSRVRNFELREW